MTTAEFSNEFDVLVNSYRRFKDFDDREILDSLEFNEYEKSLFLTRAQEEMVLSLYNGKRDPKESFEQTEEMRRYLSNLIVEDTLEPITTSSGYPLGVESNSKFFTLPENLWFITYEAVTISNGNCDSHTRMDVYPVRQDEYQRLRSNPFRGANERRALRLDLADGVIEIVSTYTVTKYYLRYLRRISPIILVSLPDDMSIDGVSQAAECELHESLHRRVLEEAVRRALASKGISAQEQRDNRE